MGILSRNTPDSLYKNRCAVNDRKSFVLQVHRSDYIIDDMVAAFIVLTNGRLAEMVLANIGNSFGCIGAFHRLGVIVEYTVYETLAIANHPYFTSADAKDGSTACETFFRMFEDDVIRIMMGLIGSGKQLSNTLAEFPASGLGRKTLYALSCEQHRQPTVSYPWKDASVGFAGAAIYNRQMMGCDDYPVLACLLALLSYKLLFENFHYKVF